MRILVTGGSSPLGDIAVPALTAIGDVTCLVRSEVAAGQRGPAGTATVRGEMGMDLSLIGSFDVLVHMAGISLAGAAADLARTTGARSLVALSSASATAVGHPNREWILNAEDQILGLPISVAILRPTMIYGSSRDRNVRKLARMVKRLPAVPHFAGGAPIQPVLADDVAAALVETVTDSVTGKRAVGGPEPVLFGELFDSVATALRKPRLPVRIPVAVLSSAARLSPTHSKAAHALEMLRVSRTVSKPAQEGFTYRPTSLEDGVRLAVSRYGLG